MATYHPNFNDPRVKSRIRKAVGFVSATMSSTPHAWSTRYIDRHLGSATHELSKWLREHLLVVESHRYNKDTGVCKEYTINKTGVRYLLDVLNKNVRESMREWMYANNSKMMLLINESDFADDAVIDNTITTPSTYPSVAQVDDEAIAIQWATEEYKNELTSLEFKYDDKASRLWHPLQNVRKAYRTQVLANAGLTHQYDIQCCAPTLIHQYAQKCGMDLYLFALNKYLNNRQAVRKEIANYASISIDDAKVIVNALLAGAQLGLNADTAIYKLLKGNQAQINKLKAMPYLTELRNDFKTCWDYIKPFTYYATRIDTRGIEKRVPMPAKQKWNIYFQQERLVLDCIARYLRETDNKYFLEHDGWTSKEIDVTELQLYVFENTGYKINIDNGIDIVTPATYPSVAQVYNDTVLADYFTTKQIDLFRNKFEPYAFNAMKVFCVDNDKDTINRYIKILGRQYEMQT